MGIVMVKAEGATVKRGSEGGDRPLVRCDACGGFVDERSSGRVAWDPDQNVTFLNVAFLHQGCVDAFRDERGADLQVEELGTALHELGRYAGSSGEARP